MDHPRRSGRLDPDSHELFDPGTLSVGCNYWASHAGIRMWLEWDRSVVEADFRLLAGAGLEVLRVFPLWPDFQPVVPLLGGGGRIRGYTIETAENPTEHPLPGGSDGVDPVMLGRLEELADLAASHGLRLIVGLITGWMSGRLYVPPAVANRNPITDPEAIRWQLRLVRAIVTRLRNHDAVAAWDLGNECNVMGRASGAESWAWTATVTGAIRSADATRPVVSGMHGLGTDAAAPWSICGQAELTDVLTTHPYPLFTPHCAQEPLASFRPILHPAAESRLYADLGGRSTFAEEAGSLGPMVAGEPEAAGFARAAAWSLWAYDCRALLWWCAFDFDRLRYPPYEWDAVERELGLFTADGEEKQVVAALRDAQSTARSINGGRLPERIIDAACVLPTEGDWWGVAYSVFLLGVSAGLDVRFVAADQELPDAPLYILPSIRFGNPHPKSVWDVILERVNAGATLYLSLDDGIVSDFNEVFGIRLSGRYERTTSESRHFEAASTRAPNDVARALCEFVTGAKTGYVLGEDEAVVIARTGDRQPAFTRHAYGSGEAWLLTFPIEAEAAEVPGFFERPESRDLWRIYEAIGSIAAQARAVRKSSPLVGVTEHPLSSTERLVILINYDSRPVGEELMLRTGWRVDEVIDGVGTIGEGGASATCSLEPFGLAALRVRRSEPVPELDPRGARRTR